jgi:hypothetical protein
VILGVVLAPIALEIYEDVLYEGWRQFVRNDLGELMVYLTVAISAFLLWLVLRYQRKRRII